MVMKNKLYKHHKNKFVLLMRNFSLTFASIFAIAVVAAIPTYISSNQSSQVTTAESATVAKSDIQEVASETELPITIEE